MRKEAAVQAVGQASAQDMEAINRLARRELAAEEVYTFAVRLCDNEIDRDFERFSRETLEELGGLFVGVTGVFDHQWSAKGQSARLYRTEVAEEPGEVTGTGETYCYLKGYAYMMRTEDNAGLIAEIDGGIKREVSVGCAVRQVLCSVCGEELGQCGHQKGERYDGQVCHGVLSGASDAYEWSFVAVPAQRRAGVVKSAQVRDEMERQAALGRKYLNTLRQEVVRLGCLVQTGADRELMEKVAARLGEDELSGLRRLYRKQADRLFPEESQLCAAAEMDEIRQGDSAFLI